jgi:membrane protein
MAFREPCSRFCRFARFQLRIWPRCARLLIQNDASRVAAALSYQTIFGLVPLAIVELLAFTWIGSVSHIGMSIKELLYQQAFFNAVYTDRATGKSVTLADKIDQIVTGYFHSISAGSITIVSLIFVIWAALALLITIEMSFNHIYNVQRGRSNYQRVVIYWGLLTLGSILAGTAVAMSIYAVTHYGGKLHLDISYYIGPIVPSVISIVVLFLMYFFIPNTKVEWRAALWGAVVAGVIWDVARWGFRLYVTELIPYNAIYGILGLIPLTVLWIYISWLIVLFGLELAYTTQNITGIEEIEAARREEARSFFVTALSAVNVLAFIAAAFEKREPPVSADAVCRNFSIPPDQAYRLLDFLVEQKLLVRTAEPEAGFVPAGDPATIRLSEVFDLINRASLVHEDMMSPELRDLVAQHRRLMGNYTLRQIIG